MAKSLPACTIISKLNQDRPYFEPAGPFTKKRMTALFKLCNYLKAAKVRSRLSLRLLIVPSLTSLLLLPVNAASSGQSQLVERSKRPLFVGISLKSMPEATREVAEELEILPMLGEIYNTDQPAKLERKIIVREKILETILESYFDAASVLAEAEREQVYLEAQRETLVSKRDKKVELNNATNFIASGTLNTVGSILGFSAKTPPFPGNLNQMLSGVVSATMSTYALKQNGGEKISRPGRPTMLAELFGRPTDFRTRYPESVWRFLHSPSVDEPNLTRVQLLEESWILNKHLERHGSKREKLKIDLACGVGSQRKVMTLDDLSDQIAMIADVAAVSDLMVHHLRDLLRMIDTDAIE